MKKILLGLGLLMLSFVFVTSAFAVGNNGSFENGNDPGSFTTLNAGSSDITNWEINSGSIDYIGSYWTASDGARSVDLNGLGMGSISQNVDTVIGATYDVSFDMSGNPESKPEGDNLYSPNDKGMSVSATGTTPESFTYNTMTEGNSLSDMKWQNHVYSFVATAASTTLAFASTTPGAFGPAIDNVKITETLPTPQCNANATQTIVSDTNTIDTTDDHPAVAVTPHPGWTLIPSEATWIYSDALDVNGSSPTGTKTFTRTFTIAGTPLDSSLQIASDNMYSVAVNGSPISTGTSATDLDNFSSSDTWTIPAAVLVSGLNTITFTITNPAVNPIDQTPFPDPNPAGLLYKLVVNNNECVTPNPEPQTLRVRVLKYLDGVVANSTSANNYQFPMTATWQTANLNGGVSTSGNYVLGNNHGGALDQYGADTAPMDSPANYTTSEITDSSSQVVSSLDQCTPGKYLLNGYRTSDISFADAMTKTLTAIAPVFTGLTSDQYLIVDNSKCPTFGTISGMKYNDLNRNGIKDPNEVGLSGWTIRLILDNNSKIKGSGDILIATTITDANGNYTFSNIDPGTYVVRETNHKGWKRISKNPKSIVILSGSVVTGVDFGNAIKKRVEKEDTLKDDNRDEQQGKFYANHGKNNYR